MSCAHRSSIPSDGLWLDGALRPARGATSSAWDIRNQRPNRKRRDRRRSNVNLSEAELKSVLSRPAIARRNPTGTASSDPGVQESQAHSGQAPVHRQRSKAANESDRRRFRLSVALRYRTKHRRDTDGAISTILDSLLAARRRLLDLYTRNSRDSGTGP